MRERTFAFSVDGLTLSGELVVPDGARATVLLCHGIPGGGPPDPTDAGYPGFARTLAQHGFAGAWFNFRGCRDAPGDFSAQGWTRDLNAALDALLDARELNGLPLTVAGSSMGGSVGIVVCSARDDVAAFAGLAAPAAFDEPGGLADDPALLLQRFRNIGIVRDPAFPRDVDAWAAEFLALRPDLAIAGFAPRPVLIMHGEADDVVPYVHAERLFSSAKPLKELVRIPAGGHQLRRDPRAVAALVDWLNRTKALEPPHDHGK
jgi:fermentation-respiration switch protein FrsA (DUF1100 family)